MTKIILKFSCETYSIVYYCGYLIILMLFSFSGNCFYLLYIMSSKTTSSCAIHFLTIASFTKDVYNKDIKIVCLDCCISSFLANLIKQDKTDLLQGLNFACIMSETFFSEFVFLTN